MSPSEKRVEYIKNIILNQLSSRPRSRHELEIKLLSKDVTETEYTPILDRYEELGFVNDREFARLWATSRFQNKHLGRHSIRQELQQKGIDDDIILEVLEDISPDSFYEKAYELAEKKLARMQHLSKEVKTRRVVGLLTRKGHPVGVSYQIVQNILEQEIELKEPITEFSEED